MSQKGQLWCLSWWFCLLSWDNSDRCGIFWLGWLMDVWRYEGLRHLCGHLQPDFGEWVGVAPSMSLWPIFCNLLRSGNLPLWVAPENGPHQAPRKRAFSWVSQRKLDAWWGPFSGANPSGKLALRRFPPIFFLNIKLPFWNIDGATPTHSPKSGCKCPHSDGATPSYLPTSINKPNQNMPHRSELSQDRRQNHQERHQSCPRTGGKTTRKDIRVVLFGTSMAQLPSFCQQRSRRFKTQV